jgi:hypothetical protein
MLPFMNCNFKLDMSALFEDLIDYSWTKHGHNMPTCNLPYKFDSELRKIFKLPIDSYIMLHNLVPIHTLQSKDIPYLTTWHVDSHRKSAIFIPVSLDNADHYTEFMYNNSIYKAPYSRGIPLLFNVKVLHKVSNNDAVLPRNVISIGLPTTSYSDLVSSYQKNLLVDKDSFADNLFNITYLE